MRYRSLLADSARWEGFELRPGDIIVSTPPKSGTTWTQMLCALLVFDGPEFPGPLEQISFWFDQQTRSVDEVRVTYGRQEHRRIIKTHTPLDGLPDRSDVVYVVVGRDPRDVAVSMEHHLDNMDMEHVMAQRARAVGLDDLAELPPRAVPSEDPAERLRRFVHEAAPSASVSLAGVLHHLHTGWDRRTEPNVVLCHYADYQADLPAEIDRLAVGLGIDLAPGRAAELAPEAAIGRMRERADEVVPSASKGQWRDVGAFLRAGATGEWRDRVDDADAEAYDRRVAALVPPDLAAWSHLGRRASGIEPSVAR